MSAKRPERDFEEHPNGVLVDPAPVDTTGVIDGTTAQIQIVLPASSHDDADDLVDDEALVPVRRPAARTPRATAKTSATAAKAPVVSAKPSASAPEKIAPLPDMPLASKRLGEIGGSSAETADLLTSDRLIDAGKQPRVSPEGGWRRFVYAISGHLINPGDSKKVRARKQLSARISAPLPGGARFVAVLSRKGGVGKTTVTTLLGMAMADARRDRVVAVDANPDRGTLADRIAQPTSKSVRDLSALGTEVGGYQDISEIVARDATRLDVLASNSDPQVAEAFHGSDYRTVADIAARFYSMVLTDTGTGIVHSAMTETLAMADQVVVVAGLSVDEARLASETLTWLVSNGHENLARDAIVVLNKATPGSSLVREQELEKHFATRVRHVLRMPYDPQIAAGGPIVFSELAAETRSAARNLAALVVDSLRLRSVR